MAIPRATPKVSWASKDSQRPFRLWDAKAKKELRWRYYGDRRRAHFAALVEARWADVGTCIEVYDASTGHLCGQYMRRVNNVEFTGE